MQTSVEAIASKLVDSFHIEMDIYQVAENSMEALNNMGMLNLSRKGIVGRATEQQLRMPVETVDVKAVFPLSAIRAALNNTVTITIQDIYHPPQTVWIPVPNSDSEVQLLTLPDQVVNYIQTIFPGPYIDFIWDPPFLKFNESEVEVAAIFTAISMNKDTGYPEIPIQAFEACVNYCAWIYYRPLYIQGKVAQHIWNEIKEWKRTKMAQAETKLMMSKLSSNEMSRVHSIMSSFDRKRTRLDS